MLYHDETRTSQDKAALPKYDRSHALSFAFEYFDRGFSVIPMRGKAPSIPWKKYQSEKATRNELKDFFGPKATENFNLGIVTGRVSGIVVVDVDDQESLDYWENNYPSTPLVAKSGGIHGGQHFFYQAPADVVVRNRVKVDGRGIDIRAERAVIVAPPSVHPETGANYRWMTPFDEWSLDDMPVFQTDWISSPQPPPARAQWTAAAPDSNVACVRQYVRRITATAGHNGHGNLYRATCKLRDAGLSADQALAELELWNQTNAFPPWSTKELVHKVNSVFGGSLESK